jgi:23S rRNA (cytosine1962-C5)-methyltransferase
VDPFDIKADVEISPAGIRRIRSGHLWVYAGDVLQGPDTPEAPLVRILDGNRRVFGYGLYSPASQIRLRVLTRDTGPPSAETLREKVRASISRRPAPITSQSAMRLVFAEADLLPSIVVDRYDRYLVLQTLSSGAEALKPFLVEILKETLRPVGILERNDVKARRLEGLEEKCEVLWGEIPEEVEILEGDVFFLVDLMRGQKTGFFLDQSENRIAASRYVSGRALDCFSNTGAFALHFASRCESVLAIETSREALRQAGRNAQRNGLNNVEFREGNVFDMLKELDRSGHKFDAICLDPPAFAKNREARAGARGGYKEINLRAMRILRPEGVLVTSSCSFHISEAEFFHLIVEAAHDAHRYVQVIERRSQSADHPVLASMPETHYLKCFILRIL